MNCRGVVRSWLVACGLLAAGACTKTLTIDESGGAAAAGGSPSRGRSEPTPGDGGIYRDGGSIATPTNSSERDAGGDAGGEDRLPVATTRWTGNPSGCPNSRPEQEETCEVAEGQVCAYFGDDPEFQTQSYYTECACMAFCGSSATERHWDCYRNVSSQRMDCPATQPEHGSSCFGLKGYGCYYPTRVSCRCPTDADDSGWRCEYEGELRREQQFVVEMDKLVRDLSDAEREAWCEWYTQREPGFPPPPELEPNAEGYYPDTGCNTATEFLGCTLSRPTGLPASACVANLALSECEATVRDLSDCVSSMEIAQPAPYGCARYLDGSGCSGTIVTGGAFGPGLTDAAAGDGCLIRVR